LFFVCCKDSCIFWIKDVFIDISCVKSNDISVLVRFI
jgi:hypothetical protein